MKHVTVGWSSPEQAMFLGIEGDTAESEEPARIPGDRIPDPHLIPGLARRLAAKLIDFVAVGFTVVGFSALFHSYLGGLIIGYGWLACSDWSGSLGKPLLGLEVMNRRTWKSCGLMESFLRNLPIIATVLPYKLHQAILGIDRQTYRENFREIILFSGVLALVWVVATLIVTIRNAEHRRIEDYLANTIVLIKMRKEARQEVVKN